METYDTAESSLSTQTPTPLPTRLREILETPHTPTGIPDLCQEMYDAVIAGDLAAVEDLMGRDNSLAWRELTQEGDKALHLAIGKKHADLAAELMGRLGADQIAEHDGHGYTACCYAAMCDMAELVRSMVETYPTLLRLQSCYDTNPCTLAVACGSIEVISYVLSLDALTEAEWFDLLMLAIDAKTFDVALAILEKNGSLTQMKCDGELTPLHVLAQLDVSIGPKVEDETKMQSDFKLLAEKLWENIQHLGRKKVGELITNPPLLREAVIHGNEHLVTMITRGYPYLLFRVDLNGHNLLHAIIASRRLDFLPLVHRAKEYFTNFNCFDKDKNNPLHYAAMLFEGDVNIREAYEWYKVVEAVMPSEYQGMKNKKGYVPEVMFWKERKKLLVEMEALTKKRAESSMIFATVLLTLVFAAVFAPPGGYDQNTGIPLLSGKKIFKYYVAFEMFAIALSWISISGFLYIITTRNRKTIVLLSPSFLRYSKWALMVAVVLTICAMCLYIYLEFLKEISLSARFKLGALIPMAILLGYLGCVGLAFVYKEISEAIFDPKRKWMQIKHKWKQVEEADGITNLLVSF